MSIAGLKLCALALLAGIAVPALAQGGAAPASTAATRDGSRDFDFEHGSWRTELRRLRSPLSGSNEWVDYQGTSVVRPVMGGRANLVELSVEGPAGRIEGVSLRLYNPTTRQWSLNFASLRSGEMTPPVVGAFSNGRGTFIGRDTWDGRPILVRFVISEVTANSARFEQAFSADEGATLEVNWIAVDTRIAGR